MIKEYVIPLFCLVLIGCSAPIDVLPNTLPDAYLNQPYQANIEVTGGVVVELNFHSELSDDSFKIIPSIAEGGYKDYNLLTVTGTPTTSEPIRVYVAGDTYGTNFPGKRFDKEYTIEVRASK